MKSNEHYGRQNLGLGGGGEMKSDGAQNSSGPLSFEDNLERMRRMLASVNNEITQVHTRSANMEPLAVSGPPPVDPFVNLGPGGRGGGGSGPADTKCKQCNGTGEELLFNGMMAECKKCDGTGEAERDGCTCGRPREVTCTKNGVVGFGQRKCICGGDGSKTIEKICNNNSNLHGFGPSFKKKDDEKS